VPAERPALTTPPEAEARSARRLRLWLPVALLACVQVGLSSLGDLPSVGPALPGADKLQHAAWFALLALFAYRAGRVAEGWSRRRTVATVILAALAWGASDEWHQSFVPGRAVELADLVADVLGAALGATVAEPVLRRAGRLSPPR
jgi:VanZ family protein